MTSEKWFTVSIPNHVLIEVQNIVHDSKEYRSVSSFIVKALEIQFQREKSFRAGGKSN